LAKTVVKALGGGIYLRPDPEFYAVVKALGGGIYLRPDPEFYEICFDPEFVCVSPNLCDPEFDPLGRG
jgi:hypothetical protein